MQNDSAHTFPISIIMARKILRGVYVSDGVLIRWIGYVRKNRIKSNRRHLYADILATVAREDASLAIRHQSHYSQVECVPDY